VNQDSEANAIELRVQEISQLFNTLDPFPFRERDLDRNAEEFIVGWAQELTKKHPIRIIVHLPAKEAAALKAGELAAALTTLYPKKIALDLNGNLIGNSGVMRALVTGTDAGLAANAGIQRFLELRRKYLIYR